MCEIVHLLLKVDCLTLIILKVFGLWVVTLCSLAEMYQCFRRICCFLLIHDAGLSLVRRIGSRYIAEYSKMR
jgi:hypothetical protein